METEADVALEPGDGPGFRAEVLAEQVADKLQEAGLEVSEENALKELAIIDAEQGVTFGLDGDEMDDFLDEFEEAIQDVTEKDDALADAIEQAEGAGNGSKESEAGDE